MRIVLALLMVSSLHGGSPMRSSGKIVKWKNGKLSLKVSRSVHLAEGETGVDRRETAASVHAAAMEAVRAWNETGRAAVKVEAELTDETKVDSQAAGNLVTFTDPGPFDSGQCHKEGYVACTVLSFDQETGEIQRVYIAFNPYLRHSSIGFKGTHDLALVMLHEVGHALGLDHSALLDSVMAASVELAGAADTDSEFGLRRIANDDALTLGMMYPIDEGQEPALGRIEGNVKRRDVPLPGAHVLALDRRGRPMHSAVTMADGSYTLLVPAGEYRLAAEPLDGPVLAVHMASPPAEAAVFQTVFWNTAGGNISDAMAVSVEGGQRRQGIDFWIPRGPAANIGTVGQVESGRYVGRPRAYLARGREYTLGVTRSPAEGVPAIKIWTDQVVLDGEANFPSSAPQLVRQKVRISEGTRAGSYVIQYSSDGIGALMPGALTIVPNPHIQEIRDAVTGAPATTFRAGQMISITGWDLAWFAAASHPWEEGAARPTQLGGASVRIGDRWARLFAVTPEEIVAIVPEGLEADAAVLRVVTGNEVESEAVTLQLLP
jgi:hypothetical protein